MAASKPQGKLCEGRFYNSADNLRVKAGKFIARAMKDERHAVRGSPKDFKYLVRARFLLHEALNMLLEASKCKEMPPTTRLDTSKAIELVEQRLEKYHQPVVVSPRYAMVKRFYLTEISPIIVRKFTEILKEVEGCACKDDLAAEVAADELNGDGEEINVSEKPEVESSDGHPFQMKIQNGRLVIGAYSHTISCVRQKIRDLNLNDTRQFLTPTTTQAENESSETSTSSSSSSSTDSSS